MNKPVKARPPATTRPDVILGLVAVGDYRADFMDLVVDHYGLRFQLMTGTENFGPFTSIKVNLGPNMRVIRNWFLFGRRIVLQPGMVVPCLRAETVVLSLNPRILTGWVILVLRRLLGKKTILWGHVWPRAGQNSPTDKVRGLMRGLADVVIAYTHSQAKELLEVTPDKPVFTMPNALYREAEMTPAVNSQAPTDYIYVGRLVEEKKPELLLEAYALLVKKVPQAGGLVFIGSGSMQDYLAQRAAELGLSNRVRFTGHIGDVNKLREFYRRSIVSVSPGYVGLSLIQSLGFGVPMIIADDEPHAPEVEAVREGENARYFTAGSAQSLADELERFTEQAGDWHAKRQEICNFARERYSSESMARGFIAAVARAQGTAR